MGSIRWRGYGRYQALYRDPDGRQRGKTFRSERDARRYLETVGADLQRSEWRDPNLGKQTFGEIATTWRAQKAGLRAGTLSNYDTILRRHLLPYFASRPVGKVQPANVREWRGELQHRRIGQATIAKAYRILTAIFDLAVEDRLITASPVPTRDPPRAPTPVEMMFLTPEAVTNLAEAIGTHYKALIYTAAYTGLRWGELAGLTVGNIDPLHRTIRVVQQLTDTRGQLTPAQPKTKAGRRTVEMPAFLIELITPHMAGKTPQDLVFVTQQGAPLRQANFRKRIWLPATEHAGLQGLRFHDLRHTHVALSIAAGAELLALSRRLGHTRTSFTLDRYGHLLPGADTAIADALGRLHAAPTTNQKAI